MLIARTKLRRGGCRVSLMNVRSWMLAHQRSRKSETVWVAASDFDPGPVIRRP